MKDTKPTTIETAEGWEKVFDEKFVDTEENEWKSGRDYSPTPDQIKQFIKDHSLALLREVSEQAKATQKANIEQHMVYLFKKMPSFLKMSLQRKNRLWSAMCGWTDEYLEKPYKDIETLIKKYERTE